MRIQNFEVKNVRSVALAECPNVPKLMIIAGPNGSGKSTLLYELRKIGGRQHILYVGPHRSGRRHKFRQRDLYGKNLSFEDLLCQDKAPKYDQLNGVNMGGEMRDPWNADESASYLKFAMCQIEIERQEAIAKQFDRTGEIIRGSMLDPWEPFRQLTNSLLPHLNFVRVDSSDRNSIRCIWSVHSRNTEVDLDDLSSGEKAVIQMFYPLLEHQIHSILAEIKSGFEEAERAETCVLIDEPELHLHPNLQMKVLDYLRILTAAANIQVIVVSHSPTLVEHATFEELFLLRPVELVGRDENQLIQIATDEERLRLLRDVFGTTSNVTAMQPIIIVEGASQTAASVSMSDRKLYRALSRDFDAVTLIPGGGNSECRKLLGILNELLPSFSPQLNAVALLDRDVAGPPDEGNIHLLPVSMIENFLLDPLPLWEAIQSVVERTTLASIDDVTAALDAILDDLRSQEVERRAKATLGLFYFRPESPSEAVPANALLASQALIAKYSLENVTLATQKAEQIVAGFEAERRRRENFHGKDVLERFYQKHLQATGLSKVVFKFEAARHARERKSVSQFFREFFTKILEKKKLDAALMAPTAQ